MDPIGNFAKSKAKDLRSRINRSITKTTVKLHYIPLCIYTSYPSNYNLRSGLDLSNLYALLLLQELGQTLLGQLLCHGDGVEDSV